MPDTKISGLNSGTPPQDADEFPVRRSTGNNRLSWLNLRTALASLFAPALTSAQTAAGGTAVAALTSGGVLLDAAGVEIPNALTTGLSLTPFLAAASNEFGAALQAAHDALGPDGGTIIIPAVSAYYTATTTAAFTKPVILAGCGIRSSEVYTTTAAITVITTTSHLVVRDMGFVAGGSAVGNSTFIKVLAAATGHNGSIIQGCRMELASRCVWSERANSLVICNSTFAANNGYCLYLENLTNSDEGDNIIYGNSFSGFDATCICVYVASTAGINFSGNKFNGPALGHVFVNPNNNAVGNFLFSNNSLEGQSAYAIKVVCVGTGVSTKQVIVGNQFSSEVSEGHVVLGLNATNSVITGNIFSSTSSSTGVGVKVLAGAKNVTVDGNGFHQIDTAIWAPASYDNGISMSGNRFASDVNIAFLGSNADMAYAPQNYSVSLCGVANTASNSDANDVIEVQGYGTVKVNVSGLVQGVGWACAQAEYIMLGGTATQVGSTLYAGATFDLVATTVSSKLRIGAKRNGSTGFAVAMTIEVEARGHLAEFRRVA